MCRAVRFALGFPPTSSHPRHHAAMEVRRLARAHPAEPHLMMMWLHEGKLPLRSHDCAAAYTSARGQTDINMKSRFAIPALRSCIGVIRRTHHAKVPVRFGGAVEGPRGEV